MPPPSPQQKEDQALADWLSGFGSPIRLDLIRALAKKGEKSVAQLSAETGVSAAQLSSHLAVLKVARLAESTTDGQFRRYSLIGATITDRGLEMTHESGTRIVIPLD